MENRVQINLLPWREQARQIKRKQFLITLAGFIGLTLLFVAIYHIYLDSIVSNQNLRNSYLQTVLNQEQSVLLALEKQKEKQTQINLQLHFLYSLRETSYNAVQILNELTQVVPEGVSLIKLTREGNTITLLGGAQSSLNVTLFMKNISNSHIFNQPDLTEITTKQVKTGEDKYFQLIVKQGKEQTNGKL